MTKIQQILDGDVSNSKVLSRGSKTAKLFFGRFQPISAGDEQIINELRESTQESNSELVIGVVRGKASSQNTKKNPLSFADQKTLIEKVAPDATIIEFESGFIPDMAVEMRNHDLELIEFMINSEKNEDFSRQFGYFTKAKAKVSEFVVPEIKAIVSNVNFTWSAEDIREVIHEGILDTFEEIMPKVLHGDRQFLQEALVKNI